MIGQGISEVQILKILRNHSHRTTPKGTVQDGDEKMNGLTWNDAVKSGNYIKFEEGTPKTIVLTNWCL
jgi:hypothetical protein